MCRTAPRLSSQLIPFAAIMLAAAALICPRALAEGEPPSVPARAGKLVSLTKAPDAGKAYLATPKEPGAHPGVIVIQEWWGLNNQIKLVADDLASKGYVALAPDLYRGKLATTPDSAMALLNSLPESRALGDITAAFAYLRALPSVGTKPIGSIGFCMGGGYSLKLALNEPTLAACVICYGRLESDPEKLIAIGGPVLGIFGGADKGIPQEMIDGFKKGMEAAARNIEIKVYPEAGHGFLNPNNPGHRPDDAKDAWRRIEAFFAKHLVSR